MVIEKFKTILVAKLTKKTTLMGSIMGMQDVGLFASVAQRGAEDSILFDWTGVEIATGSYFNAAYLPLFRVPSGFPILTTGLTPRNREELEFALKAEGRSIFILEKGKRAKPALELVGELDDAYRSTMEALAKHRDASPSELYSESHGIPPQIGKTAWINRLTRIHEMGLIHRTVAGKGYRYSTISV